MKLVQMPVRVEAESGTATESGVLQRVWATEGNLAHAVALMQASAPGEGETPKDGAADPERAAPVFRVVLAPQTAFYRSYTEAMLRRYCVLSMERGRVPSLLGRQMFRGKVTSYRVHAFDDVVIFVHDVEQCIRKLSPEQQRLIVRIGVQEYTFVEAASLLRLSLRTVQRRYTEALDELTEIFLQRKLLERIAGDARQEGGASAKLVSHSPAEAYL